MLAMRHKYILGMPPILQGFRRLNLNDRIILLGRLLAMLFVTKFIITVCCEINVTSGVQSLRQASDS